LTSTEEFADTKPIRWKISSSKWENNDILVSQRSHPIPVVVNRYALLDIIQEEPETPRNHNRTRDVASLMKKKKCPPQAKMKNIVIIGDSHARGYAAKISRDLRKNYEFNGRVMPGVRLENITNLADDELNKLGKSDVVIIIGGANDVNKSDTNVGLQHLRTFIHKRHNTNIMIIAAPHRHDLQEASCVNKGTVVFNKKLHEMVETVDYVKIIQADLTLR
jgi:hypothetical protein